MVAIPENIYTTPYHTIPQTALWNLKSKGVEGLVFELEIQGHGGIVTIGIPKAWGGGGGEGLDLEFLQETDKSVLHKTLIFWT